MPIAFGARVTARQRSADGGEWICGFVIEADDVYVQIGYVDPLTRKGTVNWFDRADVRHAS